MARKRTPGGTYGSTGSPQLRAAPDGGCVWALGGRRRKMSAAKNQRALLNATLGDIAFRRPGPSPKQQAVEGGMGMYAMASMRTCNYDASTKLWQGQGGT